MVVRCAARPVVHAGARGGAREPASCGLTAVCFALSRKCHARDYSAVGCGDERDLSEQCDDDGSGEGNRGWWVGRAVRASDIGLWCAASSIRLSEVARCGRGGMRDARRSTRTQEIHSTGPDYAELRIGAECSRRRCCRARTMRYAIGPRPRSLVRTQWPHRLRPLRSADHESTRATHGATRRARERKSGCSRHGKFVRFGRRIEKAHARPVPQLRTPPPPQLRPLRSARRESACATSAHRSCARSPSARCGAGGARRAAS